MLFKTLDNVKYCIKVNWLSGNFRDKSGPIPGKAWRTSKLWKKYFSLHEFHPPPLFV
jgi:hypothetical protein